MGVGIPLFASGAVELLRSRLDKAPGRLHSFGAEVRPTAVRGGMVSVLKSNL